MAGRNIERTNGRKGEIMADTGARSGGGRLRAWRRRVAGVLVGAVLAAGLGAGVTAGPAPAGAQAAGGLTGLEKVQSAVVTNSASPKTARVACPGGKKVVGGGGWVYQPSSSANPERLALTRLQPSDDVWATGNNANADGYIAAATEVLGGTTGSWWVQAYAICADAASVPGWELEVASTLRHVDDMQQVSVGCDAADTGKRVIGTGAELQADSVSQVVLQVARVSADGRLVRAQGHADADGYGGNWSVRAHAVCADIPAGFVVRTGASPQIGQEAEKSAHAGCPSGTRLLSAGAAVTDTAPGQIALQQVYPGSNLRSLDVTAVETAPLFDTWDAIIARGICAVATEG